MAAGVRNTTIGEEFAYQQKIEKLNEINPNILNGLPIIDGSNIEGVLQLYEDNILAYEETTGTNFERAIVPYVTCDTGPYVDSPIPGGGMALDNGIVTYNVPAVGVGNTRFGALNARAAANGETLYMQGG